VPADGAELPLPLPKVPSLLVGRLSSYTELSTDGGTTSVPALPGVPDRIGHWGWDSVKLKGTYEA
jgi:hypothetical protein